ncbi:MAG: hypothetical protein H6Q05_3272 [Acidobacteria bacterium]|nr:hypothetical protein [Acidobacteriota bacterium]
MLMRGGSGDMVFTFRQDGSASPFSDSSRGSQCAWSAGAAAAGRGAFRPRPAMPTMTDNLSENCDSILRENPWEPVRLCTSA